MITWVRDHRMHHKYSETNADPHNAKRGFFFSHIGWLLVRKHPEIKAKGHTIDLSDVANDPLLRFQKRYLFVHLNSVVLWYDCKHAFCGIIVLVLLRTKLISSLILLNAAVIGYYLCVVRVIIDYTEFRIVDRNAYSDPFPGKRMIRLSRQYRCKGKKIFYQT